MDKVNKLSMEQVDYYVLNRPSYQEDQATDIYNFIAITPEDIVIVTDKVGFIKEITWNSNEKLNEEILFHIQWLLLSLEDHMSSEEVNEFIFHETPTKQRFGNYEVEFIKRENGFNLSLIAQQE